MVQVAVPAWPVPPLPLLEPPLPDLEPPEPEPPLPEFDPPLPDELPPVPEPLLPPVPSEELALLQDESSNASETKAMCRPVTPAGRLMRRMGKLLGWGS
jgi:hypothetical protein